MNLSRLLTTFICFTSLTLTGGCGSPSIPLGGSTTDAGSETGGTETGDTGTTDPGAGEAGGDTASGTEDGETEDGETEDGETEDGETEDGETEDGETEEEPVEDFAGWFFFGTVTPGVSLEGAGEYVLNAMGQELCILEAPIELATPTMDCEACEWAFEITLGAGEGDPCPELDPATLQGMVFGIGYAAEQSYRRVDGMWQVADEGFVEMNEFELAIPDAPSP